MEPAKTPLMDACIEKLRSDREILIDLINKLRPTLKWDKEKSEWITEAMNKVEQE